MDYQTALSFLLSFLGGGLVGAFVNWARVARSESRALQAQRIRAQLQHLYGPLYFLTSQAEQVLALSQRHSEGYQIEYIEAKRGTREEVVTAIEINNQYSRQLQALAKQSAEIMKGAYSYIEPEDSEPFQGVVIDAIRLEIEREESGEMKTPLEIYHHVGDIHFFRGEFIALVKKRFLQLRNKLVSLES